MLFSNQEQAIIELLDIVRDISSIKNKADISNFFSHILISAKKVFNADAVILHLLNKDKQTLEVATSTEMIENSVDVTTRTESKGLTKFLVPNKTKATFSKKNIKSMVAVPLIFGEDVIGVMSLTYQKKNSFNDTQVRLMELFANQAALAIKYVQSIQSIQPIKASKTQKYYSCFISYSAKDEEFVQKLYSELRNKQIQCWFAPADMKIGDKIRTKIDDVINRYDKLLLVLSESSITSQWVEQEVETALEKERKKKLTVLFPIRLDDKAMKARSGWTKYIRNTRNIGDFSNWSQEEAYQESLNRLLRDLEKKS